MSFLIFEEVAFGNSSVLRPTGQFFKLAGYNLLYKSWVRLGKPLNRGWHVSRAELIQEFYGGINEVPNGVRFVIDFHPTSKGRVGLVEPVDVYAYTYGKDDKAIWTPLMLRLKDVFYEEYESALTEENRAEILARIPTDFEGAEAIEFLYLNGDSGGWNWGRNGMTNAVFLHDEARDYFRPFF